MDNVIRVNTDARTSMISSPPNAPDKLQALSEKEASRQLQPVVSPLDESFAVREYHEVSLPRLNPHQSEANGSLHLLQ